MAITIVQTKKASGVGASPTVVFGSTVTAGNLLVLCASAETITTTAPVISAVSGGGATWTKVVAKNLVVGSNGMDAEIWIGTGGTGGTVTITLTYATGNNATQLVGFELAGTATSADQSGGQQNTTLPSSACAVPTLTPSVGNEIFFAVGAASAQFSSPTAGYTLQSTASANGGGTATRIATDALTHPCSFTLNTSAESVGVAVTIEPAGSSFTGSAAFSGAGTLTSTGVVVGSAAFSGSGTLASAGTPDINGAAALSGSGTLTSTGVPHVNGTAAFSGSGTLTSSGTPEINATASFSGSGTLTSVGGVAGTATFSGSGTLTSSGSPHANGAAGFMGSGTITSAGTPEINGSSALSGSGTLTSAGFQSFTATSSLSGSGTLTSVAQPVAPFSGSGTLTSVGVVLFAGTAAYSGTGTLQSAGQPVTSITSSLSGSGLLQSHKREPERGGGHGASSPRLVRVVTHSSADGDKAHFDRQIVKRPWQR